MSEPTEQSLVIGWRETVSLPHWGIENLAAKADTGARSSAIDVENIEELPGNFVRFQVVRSRSRTDLSHPIEARIARRINVRSSFGHSMQRLTVFARIRIGTLEKVIEVGLVHRRRMITRMLLGRKALEHTFLVDSGRRYYYRKPAKKTGQHRKKKPAEPA